MKITPELLKELGFEQEKHNGVEINKWSLMLGGYRFVIGGGPNHWDYYPPGTMMPWSFSVTDLEELLVFTFKDGHKCGKDAAKQELKDWINGN